MKEEEISMREQSINRKKYKRERKKLSNYRKNLPQLSLFRYNNERIFSKLQIEQKTCQSYIIGLFYFKRITFPKSLARSYIVIRKNKVINVTFFLLLKFVSFILFYLFN